METFPWKLISGERNQVSKMGPIVRLTSWRLGDLRQPVQRLLEGRSPLTPPRAGGWDPSPSHMQPLLQSMTAQLHRSCTGQASPTTQFNPVLRSSVLISKIPLFDVMDDVSSNVDT